MDTYKSYAISCPIHSSPSREDQAVYQRRYVKSETDGRSLERHKRQRSGLRSTNTYIYNLIIKPIIQSYEWDNL
jgi:hypothetical protein